MRRMPEGGGSRGVVAYGRDAAELARRGGELKRRNSNTSSSSERLVGRAMDGTAVPVLMLGCALGVCVWVGGPVALSFRTSTNSSSTCSCGRSGEAGEEE